MFFAPPKHKSQGEIMKEISPTDGFVDSFLKKGLPAGTAELQ
jgi:hypothetical protein